MPSKPIFPKALSDITKKIYGKVKSVGKLFRGAKIETTSEQIHEMYSMEETLKAGFPANVRPDESLIIAEFTPFSATAYYTAKTNRYHDAKSKTFISKEKYFELLRGHRIDVAFNQSKITRPNLSDSERNELLDKFIERHDRYKNAIVDRESQEYIQELYDEMRSVKDELGIESP